MAFIDVYNASQDADFRGRCLAAAWTTANHVLAADEGYDSSQPSQLFALKLLRGHATVTPEQIAVQVLRNATIAANVSAAVDADIDWQIKQSWTDLMAIG